MRKSRFIRRKKMRAAKKASPLLDKIVEESVTLIGGSGSDSESLNRIIDTYNKKWLGVCKKMNIPELSNMYVYRVQWLVHKKRNELKDVKEKSKKGLEKQQGAV